VGAASTKNLVCRLALFGVPPASAQAETGAVALLAAAANNGRFSPMETDQGWRKRNKKYNIIGHAHFLTFSVYKRLPLLTNDL